MGEQPWISFCCKDYNYFFLCCFLLFLFSLSYLHIGKHILHYFRHQSKKKKHGIQLRSNSQLMYRDEWNQFTCMFHWQAKQQVNYGFDSVQHKFKGRFQEKSKVLTLKSQAETFFWQTCINRCLHKIVILIFPLILTQLVQIDSMIALKYFCHWSLLSQCIFHR